MTFDAAKTLLEEQGQAHVLGQLGSECAVGAINAN